MNWYLVLIYIYEKKIIVRLLRWMLRVAKTVFDLIPYS